MKIDDGIEIAERMYQSPTWDNPRRLVMVRQQVSQRPKATGKVLRLFEDDEIINGYRHSCYITNLPYLLPKYGDFIETGLPAKTELRN